MNQFIGVKNLKLSASSLQKVKFQRLSPIARHILSRSASTAYKSALLTAKPAQYQKAALSVAKDYFKLTS